MAESAARRRDRADLRSLRSELPRPGSFAADTRGGGGAGSRSHGCATHARV